MPDSNDKPTEIGGTTPWIVKSGAPPRSEDRPGQALNVISGIAMAIMVGAALALAGLIYANPDTPGGDSSAKKLLARGDTSSARL